jgi:hypothetical protein
MAETIKFIGTMTARILGAAFKQYHFTNFRNIHIASAYLADDLDISDTPGWYEIGSGAETITESYDYGNNFSS